MTSSASATANASSIASATERVILVDNFSDEDWKLTASATALASIERGFCDCVAITSLLSGLSSR